MSCPDPGPRPLPISDDGNGTGRQEVRPALVSLPTLLQEEALLAPSLWGQRQADIHGAGSSW